jgi:NADPH:quinone reductase-like Zn-dependent oxidoreductase
VLKVVEVADPVSLATEVLVRVRAAGINLVELVARVTKGVPQTISTM